MNRGSNGQNKQKSFFRNKLNDLRHSPVFSTAYGHLPPGLTKAVIEQIHRHARQKEMRVIERDEVPIKRKPQN